MNESQRLLASVSSETPEKDRWTELELWGERGGYELVVVGESRVPGEWRREKSIQCLTQAQVVSALRIPHSSRLSVLALELCRKAAIPVFQA